MSQFWGSPNLLYCLMKFTMMYFGPWSVAILIYRRIYRYFISDKVFPFTQCKGTGLAIKHVSSN
jgi:hypothetical protein